jgi:hypothetical protein
VIDARPSDRFEGSVVLGIGIAAGLGLLRYLFPPAETRLHVAGPSGRVEADPAGLARAAGFPLDVYVLASAMQSEEGRVRDPLRPGKDDRPRLAVGRAVWNAVREDRGKLVRLLVPSGQLGTQEVNHYAATHVAPTARTLGLAQAIVDGRVPDFVEGAVRWDAPAAQDRRHARYLRDPVKYRKYRWSSADVAVLRRADHLREVRVPGVPDTRFWTRV